MSGSNRIMRTGLYLITAVSGLMLLAFILSAFQFWLFLRLPGNGGRETRHLDIEPGMNVATISRLLHREGVISHQRMFYLLCSLHKAGHKLKAGEYAFAPLATPGQVLDQLVQGRVVIHRVTLPEGSTLRDVARILRQNGLASEEKILALAADSSYIHGLDLQVSSLEGYLFPETYHVQRRQDEASILKAMVHQFRQHFPVTWQNRAEQIGFTVHEVVILASLVEKEAVVESERPLVAAVFLNRLKQNMPLQSDPTTVYDAPDFSGPITSNHLKRPSPYNTYVNKGLPIGPICNPGARSIEAVLYHGDVSYLYFVSNNDGTHHFSSTYEEHRLAVSRYREKRKSTPASDPRPGHGDIGCQEIGILERSEEDPM